MPTVDVLIPTYNPDPKFLSEALDSLLAQTYTDWKAFIHEDPSDGDTESIVKPYLSNSQITFKKSPERLGIGKNWNACFNQTNSPIVAYLFQDDYWNPDYLETAVRKFEENKSVGFISMGHEYKIEGKDTQGKYFRKLMKIKKKIFPGGFYEHEVLFKSWLKRGFRPNYIGEPDFVVMQRSVMERVGLPTGAQRAKVGPFHETMQQLLDTEYWIRMLEVTDLYHMEGNYGFFRVHGGAATAQNRARGRGIFDRLVIISRYIKKGSIRNRLTALCALIKQIFIMCFYAIIHPITTLKVIKQIISP